MAQSRAGAGAWGGATGALGGASAGAMVGTYILPGYGTAAGAVVGGALGLLGGAITGVMDADAQSEMEAALQAEADRIDAAQKNFERRQLQAGDLAGEVLTQTMTMKNTADQAKADAVMDEASQVADASGLIGAEKADYILKQRESVMRAEQANNPQVYQAALGGAKAIREGEINKAAIELQSEQNQSQAEIARIAGQELPDYSGGFGQVLGGIGQVAGTVGMINAYGGMQGGMQGALGTQGGTQGALEELPLSTPSPDPEAIIQGAQDWKARRDFDPGTLDVSGIGEGKGTEDVAWQSTLPAPEWKGTIPSPAAPQFASGGMAGATGPEVAVLGEEGPELVLNAKQTQELAQALGGAKPLAQGGVAGAEDKEKMPGYAAGGVAGLPDEEMSAEELMEYLRTLNDQFKGAL